MQGEVSRAAAEIGKGVCIASVCTLAAVLLFALCIKLFALGAAVIMPVNQLIKMLSIFAGCFFCLRPSRAFLKGAICGVAVILVTYFLFAIIAGAISFGWKNILDWLFGAFVGAISGFVCTAVKGKS